METVWCVNRVWQNGVQNVGPGEWQPVTYHGVADPWQQVQHLTKYMSKCSIGEQVSDWMFMMHDLSPGEFCGWDFIRCVHNEFHKPFLRTMVQRKWHMPCHSYNNTPFMEKTFWNAVSLVMRHRSPWHPRIVTCKHRMEVSGLPTDQEIQCHAVCWQSNGYHVLVSEKCVVDQFPGKGSNS